MSNIHPQGEALRRAIQWIAEQRSQDPERDPAALAEAAALRFDLSPKEGEFLLRFVGGNGDNTLPQG